MIHDQNWIFRTSDFARIQIFIFQLVIIILGLMLIGHKTFGFWIFEGGLMALAIHNAWILYPYTPLYRTDKSNIVDQHSEEVTILSANVYQFNKEYNQFIGLIREVDPDIILTMESSLNWEKALSEIEKDYPNCQKIPLENCYGMHFYTRLDVKKITAHFFVADDIPSIEAQLCTRDGYHFTFLGVHPPPPSPTEEDTSKERDGDLMAIAKHIKDNHQPLIAVGDFNNVAWARSSKLFRKASGLIDPRIGRGFVPTFHVDYPLFRFPIDLLFHSEEIFIKELETKESIGSDHFPMFCKFFINLEADKQEGEEGDLDDDEKEEVDKMIQEGKKENGNR